MTVSRSRKQLEGGSAKGTRSGLQARGTKRPKAAKSTSKAKARKAKTTKAKAAKVTKKTSRKKVATKKTVKKEISRKTATKRKVAQKKTGAKEVTKKTAVKGKVTVKKSKANTKAKTTKQQTATCNKERKLSDDHVQEMILEHRASARKLSRSMLRRWRARIDLQELDSIVDLALCEAALRYNPDKGASFMTFLFYHLHGYLVRAVATLSNSQTVPANPYEIAELSADTSRLIQRDGVYRTGNSNDVANALCNQEYLMPDELLYRKEMAQLSFQACGKLDNLEQQIIYRIFVDEESLVDIAADLGYSRCHISRVKKKALKALQGELAGQMTCRAGATEPEVVAKITGRRLGKRAVRRKATLKDIDSKFDAAAA